MSLAITKKNFEELLADKNNAVIAMSGAWGTGKSHLWHDLKKTSIDEMVKNSLYASLFGVRDLKQLKVKLLQSIAGGTKGGDLINGGIAVAGKLTSDFASFFGVSVSSLDDIAALAIPSIIGKHIIVIDDIERKHSDLSVEEIMGFIDEFTQIYESRFVLILNSDELSDKDTWNTLREKVIDHEFALNPTPEESLEIAWTMNQSASMLAKKVLVNRAISLCKINNIRVIRKITRVIERIFLDHASLGSDVYQQIIPSTVLLAAIHYKGMPDAPPIEFVLNHNTNFNDKREKTDKEKSQEIAWTGMMKELEIWSGGELEEEVALFLTSGLFDTEKFSLLFDKYISGSAQSATRDLYKSFFKSYLWDLSISDEDNLGIAREILPLVHHLNVYEVSDIAEAVRKISGGDALALANDLVNSWIKKYKAMLITDNSSDFYFENFSNRMIDSDIKSQFDAFSASLNRPGSLFDACKSLAEKTGWSKREINTFNQASVASFISEIESLSGDDLELFLRKNMSLYFQRVEFQAVFGDSSLKFIDACKKVYHKKANIKLVRIIDRLFKAYKIDNLLL